VELFKVWLSKVFWNIQKTVQVNLTDGSFFSTDLSLICFIFLFKSQRGIRFPQVVMASNEMFRRGLLSFLPNYKS